MELIKRYNINRCYVYDGKRMEYIANNYYRHCDVLYSCLYNLSFFDKGKLYCSFHNRDIFESIKYDIDLFEMDSFNNICHIKSLSRVKYETNKSDVYLTIKNKIYRLNEEEKYHYNSNNNIVYMEKYDGRCKTYGKYPDKSIFQKGNSSYQYNPFTKQQFQTTMNSNGKSVLVTNYSIYTSLFKSINSQMYKEYDNDNNLISSKQYDSSNNLKYHTKYEYNNNRIIREINSLNGDRKEFTYTQNRELVQEYLASSNECSYEKLIILNDLGLYTELKNSRLGIWWIFKYS